jgi:nucleotide-binding universal stress UspA family protein
MPAGCRSIAGESLEGLQMLLIRRILFPTDFSTKSVSAARYVAALTHQFGAQVTVLHVSHAHATYAAVSDVSLPPAYALDLAWSQLQESQAAEKMREFVCSSMRDVTVVPRLLAGDPATTIINQANELNADLIVMTTHGSGVLRRMLLGSVTAKVLHDAKCPVFTIPHVEPPASIQGEFRHILCAVDTDMRQQPALRWAMDFSRLVGAQLNVVHVMPELAQGQRGDSDVDLRASLRKNVMNQLRPLLDSVDYHDDVILDSGPVASKVRAAAQLKQADLVVVGRHLGSGIWSGLHDESYAIIRESPCPVACI